MTLHTTPRHKHPDAPRYTSRLGQLAALLALAWPAAVLAQHEPATPTQKITEASAPPPVSPKEVGDQVREALGTGGAEKKKLTLVVNGKEKSLISIPGVPAPAKAASGTPMAAAKGEGVHAPKAEASTPAAVAEAPAAARTKPGHISNPVDARRTAVMPAKVKMAAMPMAHGEGGGGEVHWNYEGEYGPQAWGKLKPDFALCGSGKRQSPINIDDNDTLQGPAEPLQISYQPSAASVVNNGHTIQVDVYGDNSLTVRNSSYKLVQFHFHHPSEERVNFKPYAMVAHLVHKNAEGQLAVLAVLLEAGNANPLVNKVWTYMPLDTGDRVRMPDGLLNLTELLPTDQRYYQFMGSLTTPPCSEGVLWMVLKQPVQVSREQLKLFGQLFPNNARPVQPGNGRPVRSAQ